MTASSGSTTPTFGRPLCKRSSIDRSSGEVTSYSSGSSTSSLAGSLSSSLSGSLSLSSSMFWGCIERFQKSFFYHACFLEEVSLICLWVNVGYIILFVGGRWSNMWWHIINDIPTFQVFNLLARVG